MRLQHALRTLPNCRRISLIPGGLEETEQIARHFGIEDINLVKPGIGEATRVLLRRLPWKMLVREDMQQDPALAHLYQLAREKGIAVEPSAAKLQGMRNHSAAARCIRILSNIYKL